MCSKCLLMLGCCVCACRAAGSPAEEAQEDLHRENGEDTQPVEEHCRAVCQLVSVCCPMVRAPAVKLAVRLQRRPLSVFFSSSSSSSSSFFPPLLSYHRPDTRCFSLPQRTLCPSHLVSINFTWAVSLWSISQPQGEGVGSFLLLFPSSGLINGPANMLNLSFVFPKNTHFSASSPAI